MAKLELEVGTDVLLLETGDALLLEGEEVVELGAFYMQHNPLGPNILTCGQVRAG